MSGHEAFSEKCSTVFGSKNATKQDSPQAAHTPHGHHHPKERHHWYWYGGLAVAGLLSVLVPLIIWQVDAGGPLVCRVWNAETLSSPNEAAEVELARVSCLGGAEQQKVFMRKGEGGYHSVASFDANAKVRIRWLTDREIVMTQTGGKIWAFQPVWEHVRIRYVL